MSTDESLAESAMELREKIIDTREKVVEGREKVVEERERIVRESEKVVEGREMLNKERERSFAERERIIREREAGVEGKLKQVKEREQSIEEKFKKIEVKEAELEAKRAELESKRAELEAKRVSLEAKEVQLEEKAKEMEKEFQKRDKPTSVEEREEEQQKEQNEEIGKREPLEMGQSQEKHTQPKEGEAEAKMEPEVVNENPPKVEQQEMQKQAEELPKESETSSQEAPKKQEPLEVPQFFRIEVEKYESAPLSSLLGEDLSPRKRSNSTEKPVGVPPLERRGTKTLMDKEILLLSSSELKDLLHAQKTLPPPPNKKGFVILDFYRTTEGERIWYREHIWGALWTNTDSPNCSSHIRNGINKGLFDFVLVADGWRNQNVLKAAKELSLEHKQSNIAILKESYEEFSHKYPEYIWKRVDHLKYLHLQHQLISPAVEVLPFLWMGSDRDIPDFMGENDFLLRIRNTEERSTEMRLDIEFLYEKFDNYHHQPDRCLCLDLPSPDQIDEAIDFIAKAEQGKGRVLVHCISGMFSAPAVVMAYLIKAQKMTYKQAYKFVESKKSYIFLFHFEWDKTLKGMHEKLVLQNSGDAEFVQRAKEEGNVLNLDFTGYIPTKILDGLYLGGVIHTDPRVLDQCGISHVLTVADDVNVQLPPQYSHMVFKLNDFGESDLSLVLDECCDFIDKAVTNGKSVLVHCKLGVNRSVSVLLSYLIRCKKMSLRDSIFFVRGRRPLLNPVHIYVEQLIRYEMKIHKKTSFSITEYDDFLAKW